MARKTKVKKTKQVALQSSRVKACDFQFPGEKGSYWTGIGAVGFVFLCLAAVAYFTIKGPDGNPIWYISLYVVAWPVAAVMLGNWLAAKPRVEQIKKAGRQSRVMSNNLSDMYQVLVKQSGLLGLKTPPDMYLVNDDHPIMYSLPGGRGTIIASTSLQEAMAPDEFEALLAHEIAHISCKHVRMDLAQTYIQHANIGIKLLLFPVLLMGIFARAWGDLIEFTADRGALLVTLKPAVVNAAIVKFAVAADPNSTISRQELQAYLDSAGDINSDAVQMERQFKVGQFMSSQPGLRERIEQLTDFVNEKQGKEALAKMADQQGVNLASIAMHKKASSDVEHVASDEDEQRIPE